MAVGFITGRFGADRTKKLLELCFEEARRDDRKPIFILVPEKFTYEMEKRLSEMFEDEKNIDPNFRIRVVSFSTLSKIIFTSVGGLKERKLTTSARSLLTFKAINKVSKDLVTFKSNDLKMGFVNNVMDMIIEFKQNDFSVLDVFAMSENIENESLKVKMSDLHKIYNSYESLIEKKYLDTEDTLNIFARKLDDFESIKGATIFVDEYMDFTPAQYLVIEKLITFSKNIYFSLLTDFRNLNSKMNMFQRSNSTFLNIKSICEKNNIPLIDNIFISNEKYYDAKDLAFLEKNIGGFSPKTYSEISENIRILQFKNIYEEVSFIAEEILKLIRTGNFRYNDITLCMRNLDDYSYIIKRVFEDYRIDYFLDKKISVMENPIMILILSILDMKDKNYSYDSIFRYLKSGLTGISDEDIFLLENYVIANGIKGSQWFDETWDKPILHSFEEDSDDEKLAKINEIKNLVVTPIKNLHEKLKGRNTVKEICKYLYEFTLEIELFERINEFVKNFQNEGNLYKAKEYSQVWGSFISVLDELVEFMGDDKIAYSKFINLIKTELENIELGIIPPSKDEVFVTTVDRMKKPSTKIAFVLGVNDGNFPKNIVDNDLISENEKESLKTLGFNFSNNNLLKTTDEQFLSYKTFSIAKEKLYITFPISDLEGKSLLVSRFVKKIKFIFENLKVVSIDYLKDFSIMDIFETFSKERLYQILVSNIEALNSNKLSENDKFNFREIIDFLIEDEDYKYKIEILKDKLNYKKETENIKDYTSFLYESGNVSISKLENFMRCPFSYFINYGLRAKEREVYDFSPADYGTYCHKIFDDFFKGVFENNIDWNTIDREFIQMEVEKLTKKMSEKSNFILESSPKYKYFSSITQKNIVESIEIMAEQVRRGNFVPTGFETEFGDKSIKPITYTLKNGKEIKLVGKIDRIDVFKGENFDFLRIIDYKSSKRDIDLNQVYAGLQLQLFVYMNAILSSNKERYKPAGLFYSDFTTNFVGFETYSKMLDMNDESYHSEKLKKNKLTGFVIKDMELLKNLDRTLDADNLTSEILPIKLKSKGQEIGASTLGLTTDEFDIVNEFVLNKTKDICEEIYSGNIDIRPFRYKNKKPCDYCKYKSICRFDIKHNKYNNVKNLLTKDRPNEVFELMNSENKEKRGEK
ncbi:helicase-exonuclease AddAB subunit AddB [Parvimonas parva]|uniref:Helicase-exonuclease AddAB subunit AddB n=1 Tax=Parvimonas parva TaxID=2769485 RepID=A0ABS1C991_9FIRM|nr:helicase-exonuclease AddAB subunit AddB [Parvimonas parva]